MGQILQRVNQQYSTEKVFTRLIILSTFDMVLKLDDFIGESTDNLCKFCYWYIPASDHGYLMEGLEFYPNATSDLTTSYAYDADVQTVYKPSNTYVVLRYTSTGSKDGRQMFLDVRKDGYAYYYECDNGISKMTIETRFKHNEGDLLFHNTKNIQVKDKFCGRPMEHILLEVSAEEDVTSETIFSHVARKYIFSATKSNGFSAEFIAQICEEILLGFIAKESTVDENAYDAYFLFGRREHFITKGLFVGLKSSGKFYIDHGYKRSQILIVYTNADLRQELSTITDEKQNLKLNCVNTNTSLKQAIIRTWPNEASNG